MGNIHQILKQFWGYDSFRPLQQEIIEAVLAKKNVLALLPTSAGKSICFQVPALAIDGICIVVTPLIALMKNQVENLKKRGIKAEAIYAGMHKQEIDTLLDNCIYGNIKFLYVSPERLLSTLFIERAKLMNINLLAIDEAHCISQWGYDFRPPYLQIAQFKKQINTVPIIALTASATKEVAEDIIHQLGMNDASKFRASFARKNISYSVLITEDKDQKLLEILHKIKGTKILYVRSRKRTKSTSEWLNSKGFNTDFYHAGLSLEQRNQKQDSWIKERTEIIVATNAFGMGIDKPNVRLVIHLDLPESLEAYYQEAGRAGRDEQKAYSVILYNSTDSLNLLQKINENYPTFDYLRRVYQMLANFYHLPIGTAEGETFPFNSFDFQQNFNVKAAELMSALKVLESEGFIVINEPFRNTSKLHILISNTELYNFRLKNENLDNFLKLILRLYGGELFTDFQNISESDIAKKYSIPNAEVIKLLENLHQQKIVNYLKISNLPSITFLTSRYDNKALPLKEKEILSRKKRDLDNANSISFYAEKNNQCRQKIILEYFNEKLFDDCGICDYCIHKKREKSPNEQDDTKYQQQILSLLNSGPMTPLALLNTLMPQKEKIFKNSIEILLENGQIKYDKNGQLFV